jgi:RimJ/RimL family protein N-acetyltransferase
VLDVEPSAGGTELRTARLRLRPYTPVDFEWVFRELVLDPAVVRFWDDYADPALTEADRRTMAEHDLGTWIEEGIAAGYPTWVIEAADAAIGREGEVVGVTGVFPPQNPWGPEPELGCMLASRHHGRGLGPEALGAVIADAEGRLGIPAVVGIIDEPNAASIRLVEKCGLALERSYVDEEGRPCRRYVHRRDRTASR